MSRKPFAMSYHAFLMLAHALTALAPLLSGCTHTDVSDAAWLGSDAWLTHPPPRAWASSAWVDVPFHVVHETNQSSAQDRLRSTAYVEISRKEAESLLAGESLAETNALWFLVRAVHLYEGTGRFYVDSDGRDLIVAHACLGKVPVHLRRKALIVALPKPPRRVYTSVEMVE